MQFSSQVKSTPNGTALGDGIRAAVHKATNGLLGNGTMKKLPGETQEQYEIRLKQIGTAAVAGGLGAADAAAKDHTVSAKMVYVKEWFKKFAGKLVGFSIVLTTAVMLWKWFKSRKKKGKKFKF